MTITQKEKLSLGDWLAILGGALGAFMAILDIQVTNASLREISGALSLDFTESGWISTAYLIAEIIIIPLTAFFSEAFGLRRYFVINSVGFVVSSILCGFSWNLSSLIAFRILQGFTGGTLIPLSFQLILLLMPEKQRPIGMTIFGLTVTLAPTLGPSLGGILTDYAGWRSIFFINVAPGILMTYLIRRGLPDSEVHLEKLKKLDIFSIISLVLGLGGLTFFLEDGPKNEWFDDTSIRVAFLSSLIFLPLFIVRQFTAKNPLLRLTLLKDRNFAIGTIITTLAGCALFSGIYSLSLYLSQVQDYTAPEIGAVLMWVGLPQLLVMPLVPYLMKKIDLRILAVVGLIVFAYSNFLNSGINAHYGSSELITSLIIRALGQPLFVIPLSLMAMGTIPKEFSADGSSIFNVMRNLGASFGIALTTTFLVGRQTLHLLQKTESFSGSDFALVERLYSTDKRWKQAGLDAATAQYATFKEVFSGTIRDSLTDSFADLFWVLAVALIVCTVLVILMKKVVPSGDGGGGGH